MASMEFLIRFKNTWLNCWGEAVMIGTFDVSSRLTFTLFFIRWLLDSLKVFSIISLTLAGCFSSWPERFRSSRFCTVSRMLPTAPVIKLKSLLSNIFSSPLYLFSIISNWNTIACNGELISCATEAASCPVAANRSDRMSCSCNSFVLVISRKIMLLPAGLPS